MRYCEKCGVSFFAHNSDGSCPVENPTHLEGGLSISDDDICSECKNLHYHPGELSFCEKMSPSLEWPAEFNDDSYAIRCEYFERGKNHEYF